MNFPHPNLREFLAQYDALEESDWFDLWHTHVDWNGSGNDGAEARRPFLKLLFQVFEKIDSRVRNWKKPVQVWAVIEEEDSSQDAVYLHTPNPNAVNFPYPFDGVDWGAEMPAWLREFVDPKAHEAGRCVYNGAVRFWVRSKTP